MDRVRRCVALALTAAVTLCNCAAASAADRDALARRLGPQAVVDLDPSTGTPRVIARTNGTLTAGSGGGAARIALGYVRANLRSFGLTDEDLKSLRLVDRETTTGGVEILRWKQYAGGIPVLDHDLRIALTRDGSVLTALGAPVPGLTAPGAPRISAAEALQAVGGHAQMATGDTAHLGIFDRRLAWRVSYDGGPDAFYDAIVDAGTGKVLRRVNLVKDINADVWEWYPGNPLSPVKTVSLDPWLNPGETTRLLGPNAFVYSDLNDSNTVNTALPVTGVGTVNENVAPGRYPFTAFSAIQNPDGHCAAATPCSWLDLARGPRSWTTNRQQNAVQAFYYVNRFHDHLELDPDIAFDVASGNFEGDDPVIAETLDGAARNSGAPDVAHLNNANMVTLPDGNPGRMQMYLFSAFADGFRSINGADDAAVVYHEYTHGLSNRLITDADGYGALNAPQAGAMGEAWSDFYALDFLIEEFPGKDTAADGDVYLGEYGETGLGALRAEPIDCPVGTTSPRCPGSASAGGGGFTYGDFGHVSSGPEEHADGEIWSQTLWDLRTTLGVSVTRALVTTGMRLSPPEPSFLDARNAILLADQALYGGAHASVLWQRFAARGMGFLAGAQDAFDTSPVEDFSLPPTADAGKGTVSGRVTDAVSGLPLAGATVAIGGNGQGAPSLAARSAADGTYVLPDVPAGDYPALTATLGDGHEPSTRPQTVAAAQTATANLGLARNWAASAAGAVNLSADRDVPPSFCTTALALDQSPRTAWAEYNPDNPATPATYGDPQLLVQLPQAITVTSFGIDPSVHCATGLESAPTGEILVETAPGPTGPFTQAYRGAFGAADLGRLNLRVPTAGQADVRVVRLTLLDPLAADSTKIDLIQLAGFAVFGAPPNQLPSGPLTRAPAGAVSVGTTVTFDASAITDPDSAITGYDWDFDGDGTVDQSTAGPAAAFTYARSGSYTATVLVRDYRGGSGTATSVVEVVPIAVATPAPPLLAPAPAPLAPAPVVQPQPAAPRLTIGRSRRGGLALTITCSSQCTVSARLRLDARAAKRLRLPARERTRTVRAAPAPGTRTVTLRLGATTLRRMRAAHVRSIKAAVSVTVTDALGRTARTARTMMLRR